MSLEHVYHCGRGFDAGVDVTLHGVVHFAQLMEIIRLINYDVIKLTLARSCSISRDIVSKTCPEPVLRE